MKSLAGLVSLLACLPLGVALAGDFDGSKLLICAAAEAWDCVSGDQCASGLPADFALPTFMRVDIDKRTITGPRRTTPILHLEKGAGQILLQGTELGFGWTFALNSEDGTLSGSITNREGVYAVFGSCTPL
jgi:hypothetical protein